jgi:hypothetical protein
MPVSEAPDGVSGQAPTARSDETGLLTEPRFHFECRVDKTA